jgi:hypothetical protein
MAVLGLAVEFTVCAFVFVDDALHIYNTLLW